MYDADNLLVRTRCSNVRLLHDVTMYLVRCMLLDIVTYVLWFPGCTPPPPPHEIFCGVSGGPSASHIEANKSKFNPSNHFLINEKDRRDGYKGR